MCDGEVLNLHKVLQPPTKKMPKIELQRTEEIFPTVKESMVSVVCMK